MRQDGNEDNQRMFPRELVGGVVDGLGSDVGTESVFKIWGSCLHLPVNK